MHTTVALVVILAFLALHQDAWLWNDATLVFGFLPSGLAYHAAYSIATAGLWALIIRLAWPTGLEVSAEPPGEERRNAT